MDFTLAPESKMIIKATRDFCKREIEPMIDQIIENEDYPSELLESLAKARMLGIVIPKDYGGIGSTNLNNILIAEELGKTATVCFWVMAINNSAAETIYHWGAEDIRNKFLKPLCDGSSYASIAFTEVGTGSDPRALSTMAASDGEQFIINGTKRFITAGNKPGYAIVYAKDEELQDDRNNITAFIVDKSSSGYTTSAPWRFMGLEGQNCVDIFFKNVTVPESNILGKRGEGFKILLRWIAAERIQQAAYQVGIAEAALDESLKYTRERIVGGKQMGAMQGFQWMLAEMRSKIDACRYLTYKAVCDQDAGKSFEGISAELKVFVAPTVLEIVRLGLQIHGAYGYCKEYKIERLFRYAAHAGVVASSSEINKSIVGGGLFRG